MHLVLATNEEKLARDLVTFPAWGDSLTLEQWRDREIRLRAHRWSVEAMETWLWKDAQGEALASCETFRSPSALRGATGTAYAVASVYTEPHLRGRGHASAMISALVAHLPKHDPRAQATTLFSDVGAPIYERSGYRAVPSFDRVLPAIAGDPADGVDELFEEASLASRVPRSWSGAFAVHPTASQLDWHLERERLYARLLARPRALAIGARAGSASALWACMHRSSYLALLSLEGRDPKDVEAVTRAAQRIAQAAGLREVRAWEDETWRSVAPAIGARVERSGGLAMIAPLAPGADHTAWTSVPRALWV